jgi:hypothetical protein
MKHLFGRLWTFYHFIKKIKQILRTKKKKKPKKKYLKSTLRRLARVKLFYFWEREAQSSKAPTAYWYWPAAGSAAAKAPRFPRLASLSHPGKSGVHAPTLAFPKAAWKEAAFSPL